MLRAYNLRMPKRIELPNDIESLKRLVIEQRVLLLSRDVEIEKLKIELLRLRRMRFGRSSEQLDEKIAQLELTLEELEASQTQIAAPAPIEEERPERTKPVRKALPSHLPRESITHTPACNCASCGGELERLGEDVSEVLEYVPSHFKVIRHVRPKFACRTCHNVQSGPRGPDLAGLFDSTVALETGATVRADEAYLRESILDPNAKVVAGFERLMPTYAGQLDEEAVIALVAYLKTIGLEETQP